MADELALEPVRGHQCLVALDQRLLVALAVGDIDEGDERGPIRQRRNGEVDDALIRPHHLPRDRLAAVGNAGDGAADAGPGGPVVVEGAALVDDAINVRPFLEQAAREAPDLQERRVEKLEAPVGREHGDAFVQAVQRLALHIDEGIVAALQRETLGGVVVEIGEPAVGALRRDHMDGAAVEQVPPVLVLGAGLVAGQDLGLPVAVVDHLRQARQLAQTVEQLAVRRLGGEPVGIERPQGAIGLVEERQPLIGAEDGHAGGDAIECALVGCHVPHQLALRRLQRRHVDGRPDAGALERDDDDVVRLARPAADEMHALAVGYAPGQRGSSRLALAHLQKLDLALAHLALAVGLDGLRIGLVDPLDAPARIAEPGRHGQSVEQRAPGERIAHQLAVLIEDACEVALAPGDVAQAQDRPPTRRAPVRFYVTARHRLEQ